MKAIRFHTHGGPEVLQLEDVSLPEPARSEVRVKIHASALNHMDIWVRKGLPGMAALPLIPGCDAAGTVDAVGAGVSGWLPGSRVCIFPMTTCGHCRHCLSGRINLCRDFKIFGEHQQGLHAEYACVPAENLMPLPSSLDFSGGAAFPLVYLTAWHMLVQAGRLQAGDRVLIIGATGGVGSAGVQIAKALGAEVIATAGGEKNLAAADALGADHVIDHYSESISGRVRDITGKEGVDIVFEHVGKKVWTEALKSLSWGGRLVTCGATTGPVVETDLRHIFIKQQSIVGSTMGDHEDMRRILALMGHERLHPVIDKIFKPGEIRAAHEYLESGHGVGKVVLDWQVFAAAN